MKKIIQNREKMAQDMQDSIFRKMPIEKKLLMLDNFFKIGTDLQKLNDRKRKIIKPH